MGITAGVAAALATVVGTSAAAVIAPIVVGVGTGALIGAGTAAITGGDIGMGALTGGLTGGLGGAGGVIGGALGGSTGAAVGGALGGAAGGVAGAGLTGGNPLLGAATGAIGGYLGQSSGFLSPGTSADAGAGLSAADYAALPADQQGIVDIAAENAGVSDLSAQGVPNYAAADASASPDVQNLLYGSTTGSAGGALSTAAGVPATKGISGTQLALGALAGVGQMLSKPTAAQQKAALPGPSSTAQTAGPLFNAPLQTSSNINRTAVSPNVNYYNYGQGPEQTFFANNQLRFAHGGALTAGNDNREAEFDSANTPDRLVDGDSGGQDDDVNAKLSDGEWVADANFVSALGDGNTAKGSKVLYQLRREVMNDKGMKHEVPPKLKKNPIKYVSDAQKKVG